MIDKDRAYLKILKADFVANMITAEKLTPCAASYCITQGESLQGKLCLSCLDYKMAELSTPNELKEINNEIMETIKRSKK